MDPAELSRRLTRTFLVESEEHLRVIEQGLLALESGSDGAADLAELFRAAHSLKGAARAVEQEAMVAVAHALESAFAVGALSGVDAVRLLPLLDTLKQLHGQLRAGQATVPPAEAEPRRRAAAVSVPPVRTVSPVPALETAAAGALRVDAQRVGRLGALGGELTLARRQATHSRSQLDALVAELRLARAGSARSTGAAMGDAQLQRRTLALAERLRADQRRFEQVAGELEDELLAVQLQPFAEICEGLSRHARDLGVEAGVRVELQIEGGEIEIDRGHAEALRPALLHLLRNAIAHGIEAPERRRALGKPECGRVRMAARASAARIEISVEDDGGGIEIEPLLAAVHARGLQPPDDLQQLLRLVFDHGLSTRAQASELAGRGVGLDVVREAVRRQRGRVDLHSEPGRGCRFVLSLPLRSSVLPCVLVRAGGSVLALDASGVLGLERRRSEELRVLERGAWLPLADGTLVPVVALADLLRLPAQEPTDPSRRRPLVLLGRERVEVGLWVDECVAEQSLVLQGLGPRMAGLRGLLGGSMLADGGIVLIYDTRTLVEAALDRSAPPQASSTSAPTRPRARLLVVDDSLTTRALLQEVLVDAGFEVHSAGDGQEAWRLLQELDVDIVLSDVEMPRMDGIALTRAMRASLRLRQVPLVLLTALESEHDRERGLAAGADAYLLKSGFEHAELIRVLEQFA